MPPPFRPPIGPFARFLSGVLRELGQPRQTGVYDRSAPGFMPMEFDPVTGVSSVSPTRVVSREEEEYETLRNLEGQRLGQGAFEADEYAIELAMQQPEGWRRNNALAIAQLSSPAERALIPFIALGGGVPAAGWLSKTAAPALKSIPYTGGALQYIPRTGAAFLRPISGSSNPAKALATEATAVYAANLGGQEAVRRTPEDAHPAVKFGTQMLGALGAAGISVGALKGASRAKSSAEIIYDTKKAMEVWDERHNNSAWKNQSSTTQRYKDAYGVLREAERQAKTEGYRGPVIDTSQVDSWKRPAQEGATLEPDIAVPKGAESTGRWAGYPGREQALRVAGAVDGDLPVPRPKKPFELTREGTVTPQELPVLGGERSTFDLKSGKFIEAVRDAFTATTRQQDLDARKGDLLQGREFEDRGWDSPQYEGIQEIEAELARRGVTGLGAQEVVAASGKYVNMLIASNKALEESGMKREDGQSFILDTIAESYGGNSITDPYMFARGGPDKYLVDIDEGSDPTGAYSQQLSDEIDAVSQELAGQSRAIGQSRIEETRIDLVRQVELRGETPEPPELAVETTAVEIEEDNNILSPAKQGLEVSEAADVQERGTISSAEDPEVTTTGLDERNRIVEPIRYKEDLDPDEKAFFTRSVHSLMEIAKEQGHPFEQDLREGLPQFTTESLTDVELAGFLNSQKLIDPNTDKADGYAILDSALGKYIDDLDVSLDPAHPRKGVNTVEESHIAHLREMALQEAKAAYLAGGRSLEVYAQTNPYASHTLLNAASHFAREQAATTKLLDYDRTGDVGPNPFNPDNAPNRFNNKFETMGLVDAFAEELDDIYGFGITGRTAGDIILQDFSGSKNAGLGRLRALADEWDEKYKHLSPEFYSRENMMPLFEALDTNTYKSVTRASDSLEGFPLLQQMYHDIRLLLDNHEVEFLKFLEQMSGDEDVIRRKLNAANIAQSFMGSPNYFPRNWIREGQKLDMWDAPMTPQETTRWLQSRNDMTFREMVEKRKVEPVSWNPVNMAFRRIQEGQEFMLNYLLLKHARRLEIAVDAGDKNWINHVGEGNPLRTPKLSGPAARIWKGTPVIIKNERGELEYEVDEDGLVKTTGTMAVPNSFADTLESIFNMPGIS